MSGRRAEGDPAWVSWDVDPTISKAIEIRDGVVANRMILSFQGRLGEHRDHGSDHAFSYRRR